MNFKDFWFVEVYGISGLHGSDMCKAKPRRRVMGGRESPGFTRFSGTYLGGCLVIGTGVLDVVIFGYI